MTNNDAGFTSPNTTGSDVTLHDHPSRLSEFSIGVTENIYCSLHSGNAKTWHQTGLTENDETLDP